MARLFEKARRWYEIGSEPYGNVLLLQVKNQNIIFNLFLLELYATSATVPSHNIA